MRSFQWTIGFFLIASTGLAVLAVFWWKHDQPPVRDAPPLIEPLADRHDLEGEWRRVEFSEPQMSGHWRKFAPTGEFQALYGDEIIWGTYSFIDNNTVETRNGHDGQFDRWTVGRSGDKLVLIHVNYGWVEQFVRAPVGTLRP